MTELLPCPFCGSDEIKAHYIRDGRSLGCMKCGASVLAYHPNAGDKCAVLWNTRALEATQSPETEAGEPVAFMYETDDERWLSFDQENPDCIDCDFKQTPLYTTPTEPAEGDLLAEAAQIAINETEIVALGLEGKGDDNLATAFRKTGAKIARAILAKGERKQ